jgi:hypothetical protein
LREGVRCEENGRNTKRVKKKRRISHGGHREHGEKKFLDGINRMHRMYESRSGPSLAPTIPSILFILSNCFISARTGCTGCMKAGAGLL